MQFHEEEDFSKDFHIGIWKNLLRYAKPFYKHLGLIALLMLACAALDAVLPQLTREAIDLYVANGTTESIGRFIIKYAAVLVAQVICISSFIRLAGYVEVSMCHRIRSIGFKKLQELSLSFYDKTPVGYIIARLTNDTQRLGDTIGWGLIDLLWGLFYVCITVGIMISMNAPLAFGVMLVIPIIAAAAFYFQQKILRAYREVRKINSKITGAFNEGIMGAKTTKTLVREQKNAQEFGVLTLSMKGAAIRAAKLNALFLPIVMSLGSIAASYALWRGGYDVFSGTVSFGMLTVFITYSIQLFDPITHIARTFAELQSSQAAAERVVKLIETQPEITDSDAIQAIYGDSFTPHSENWPRIKGDVTFENVSFNYSGGEEVLNHFTLHIKAGQTIALVGETGSGKSTIVNLICRFYEPSDGRILIDGVDYRERSQLWLQSNLGYVLQEPHLFSGTIRENIRYGNLNATDAQVEEAARLVDAEEFISHFEKGYDTDVGEGGNRLSTGQKQLISFARALLADPALFVLDEATSSVDTQTEQKIQKAIYTTLRGRTSFIVAHRLSTIRSADLILVIDKGDILERGSHAELIRSRGHYFDLYTNQFRAEQEQALGLRPASKLTP